MTVEINQADSTVTLVAGGQDAPGFLVDFEGEAAPRKIPTSVSSIHIPVLPVIEDTYVLQLSVSALGVPTFSWLAT